MRVQNQILEYIEEINFLQVSRRITIDGQLKLQTENPWVEESVKDTDLEGTRLTKLRNTEDCKTAIGKREMKIKM